MTPVLDESPIHSLPQGPRSAGGGRDRQESSDLLLSVSSKMGDTEDSQLTPDPPAFGAQLSKCEHSLSHSIWSPLRYVTVLAS